MWIIHFVKREGYSCHHHRVCLSYTNTQVPIKPMGNIITNQKQSSSVAENVTQFLKVKDHESGEERRLAYNKVAGTRTPGIICIQGFSGKKNSGKTAALHDFCKKHGFTYIRYDATGIGESESSIKFKDARFSHWLQDAEEVLLRLTEGPQLVIASSMGAWIACILAKKYPAKFNSLLLLAPAINFARYYIQLIKQKAPPTLLERLESGESYDYHDPKDGTFTISLQVFQDMIPYELNFEAGGFPVTCPVCIIHGTADEFIPSENSLKLVSGFESSDISLLYVKGADHFLSDPKDLDYIYDTILKIMSPSTVEESTWQINF